MTTPSKRKGDTFERELAAHLSAKTGLTIQRAPLSGGGFVGGLAGGADLMGTPGLHIEAKRVEKLSFPAALAQAYASVAKTGAPEAPVVINRRSRQSLDDAYVLLDLKSFLPLYNAWLREQGHTKPQ
jgi:hypothetical protein